MLWSRCPAQPSLWTRLITVSRNPSGTVTGGILDSRPIVAESVSMKDLQGPHPARWALMAANLSEERDCSK